MYMLARYASFFMVLFGADDKDDNVRMSYLLPKYTYD